MAIMREATGGFDGIAAQDADFSALLSAHAQPRVWGVGALCRAVADALEARFNPVTVRGEITGFSRAASGHCYFGLKDASGQIRCAMFRRAATLLNFAPRDGELVEVRGKLGVYEQRGDLQLIVESMQRAGQGALYEQFLRLKAQLESEGLFDPARKRPIPAMPRGIGLVTSLDAAALQDVASALQRRVPHIPVWLASASVQGAQAPAQLCKALSKLYLLAHDPRALEPEKSQKFGQNTWPRIDVILLVRGGGSLEDLWAFNDETLARLIVQSPVPLICGVGHETDFSIADFCADLRAPTPTAAAELCAVEREVLHGAVSLLHERLNDAVYTALDKQAQRLDKASVLLARPSDAVSAQRLRLQRLGLKLEHHTLQKQELLAHNLRALERDFPLKMGQILLNSQQRLDRAERALALLHPQHTLQRGFALLQDASGRVVSRVAQARTGQSLQASVSDGTLDVVVQK